MPTTPPPDKKQEQSRDTSDAAWGEFSESHYPSGEEAGAALRRLMEKLSALRKKREL